MNVATLPQHGWKYRGKVRGLTALAQREYVTGRVKSTRDLPIPLKRKNPMRARLPLAAGTLSRSLWLVGLTFLSGQHLTAQTFTVDFSQWTSAPFVKDKFGVYQTPLKTQQAIQGASRFLSEAEAQDIRYETGIGKPGALAYGQVSGAIGSLQYDFSSIDGLTQSWRLAGTHPLLAVTYDPLPLQPNTAANAWEDVPDDLPSWGAINTAYSSHLLQRGLSGVFYEQWNEPDLPDGSGGKVFFNGTATDYGHVFQSGLAGVRGGDPDAPVGGPAIAYDLTYLDAIWPQHPDFVSIHAYANYKAQLDNLRGRNGDVVFTPTMPMFLTEYNSYTTFGTNQPDSLHPAAPAFFNDVNGMLNISDAAKVYWAQWVDSSLGMLTDDLHRKAIYNAYKIYQTMLPVDRSPVAPAAANNIGAMAGSDPHNASIVLYNTGSTDASATVQLNNLPFFNGIGEVYLIDQYHASYLDGAPENLAASQTWQFGGNNTSQTVTVKAGGVALVKLRDGSGRSLLGENSLGTLVQRKYDFFNRIFTFEDDAFNDLDPRTSIARLGMATTTSTSNFGVAVSGSVYDNPVQQFTVTVNKQGPFSKNDNNSIFGLRIDYQSTGGTYTHSVLFHNGLYNPTRTSQLPWGEGTAVPDQAVAEANMNTGQPFTVNLAQYAPANWNGKRVIVSPLMQNAGYGSYARMILRPLALRCFGVGGGQLLEANPAACTTAAAPSAPSTLDLSHVGDPLPLPYYFAGNSGPLDTRVAGLTPGKTYNLRLHFAELQYSAAGQRDFNILLNGSTVFQNFDIIADAGAANTAVVKQAAATAGADGTIHLQLMPGSAGSPLLNGLEVY